MSPRAPLPAVLALALGASAAADRAIGEEVPPPRAVGSAADRALTPGSVTEPYGEEMPPLSCAPADAACVKAFFESPALEQVVLNNFLESQAPPPESAGKAAGSGRALGAEVPSPSGRAPQPLPDAAAGPAAAAREQGRQLGGLLLGARSPDSRAVPSATLANPAGPAPKDGDMRRGDALFDEAVRAAADRAITPRSVTEP